MPRSAVHVFILSAIFVISIISIAPVAIADSNEVSINCDEGPITDTDRIECSVENPTAESYRMEWTDGGNIGWVSVDAGDQWKATFGPFNAGTTLTFRLSEDADSPTIDRTSREIREQAYRPRIRTRSPSSSSIEISPGSSPRFSVEVDDETIHEYGEEDITIGWYLDGEEVGSGTSYQLPSREVQEGESRLEVIATDDDERTDSATRSWELLVQTSPPSATPTAQPGDPKTATSISESADGERGPTQTSADTSSRPQTVGRQSDPASMWSSISTYYAFLGLVTAAGSAIGGAAWYYWIRDSSR